jgi:hypothetical protein
MVIRSNLMSYIRDYHLTAMVGGGRVHVQIEYLRLYTQYCSNQAQAGTRLKELKDAKPELHQLLEEMRELPDINRLDLESFLIKPMQVLVVSTAMCLFPMAHN